MPDPQEEHPDRVIIRDKRKIDPVTGEVRVPNADPSSARAAEPVPVAVPDEASNDQVVELESALAERTSDLQRLQAEYANYRKRVDRDRVSFREGAVRDVLIALLPILDDIDRARSHGDLDGAFKSVADQLELTLTKIGLESFGAVGDAFDPAVHEAVTHNESSEVAVATATLIMRRGYRHADRLVRAAMVGVSEPAHSSAESSADGGDGGAQPPAGSTGSAE